MYTIGI